MHHLKAVAVMERCPGPFIFDMYSNSDVSCDVILQHEWTRCGETRSVYVVDHNLSVFVEVVQVIHKTLKT